MAGSVVYLIEDITTLREQDEKYIKKQLELEYCISAVAVEATLNLNPSVFVCASNTYIPRVQEVSFGEPSARTTAAWIKNYGVDLNNPLRR